MKNEHLEIRKLSGKISVSQAAKNYVHEVYCQSAVMYNISIGIYANVIYCMQNW